VGGALHAAGLAVAAAGIALAAAPAWAGPEMMELHGYVEPCTVGNAQDMYTDCELCPSGGDPKRCDGQYGAQGYKKNCRTRGEGHAWDEVWCHPRPALAAQAAEPPSRLPVVVAGVAVLGALAVVGGVLAKRRAAK
jgi:hypothetical protein